MLAPKKKFVVQGVMNGEVQDVTRARPDDLLPEFDQLNNLLGLNAGAPVADILGEILLGPLRELTSNRGKGIRRRLVALSCRLINESGDRSLVAAKQCKACAEVVELIHTGSLVVDDIEDGSSTRRGRPALHVRYGLPLALNAGNWLYFWPFELLKELRWPRDKLLFVYEQYHRTLLKAHFGQALDLGGRVEALPPHQITEICLASMQLKTGALMGFAVSLGGVVGGAPKRVLTVLDDFGRDLGVALQMFDDLGNVIGRREPSKKYEDLMLHRPSWIWACAASNGSKDAFDQFASAVRKLPDWVELEEWFVEHDLIARGRQRARDHLNSTFEKLEQLLNAEWPKWSRQALAGLREVGEEIALAYG